MARDKDKVLWREIARLYDRNMFASTALLSRGYVIDHPKQGIAWLYYGASLAQLSRYTPAISALRRAARFFPPGGRYLVYFHFGMLYERKGAIRVAESWYRRGIENCPSDGANGVMLGRLLHRAGRLHEAAAVLRRTLRCKKSDHDEALLHLGLSLLGLERYRKARECFVRALGIDPKYKEARRALLDVDYVLEHTRKT